MMLREPGRLTFLERIQMIPEVWRLEDPVADRRRFIGIAAKSRSVLKPCMSTTANIVIRISSSVGDESVTTDFDIYIIVLKL